MATLIVVTEQHFLVAGSGEVFVVGSEDRAFFSRYLGAFDEVIVMSRASRAGSTPASISAPIPANAKLVTDAKEGQKIRFEALSDFRGVSGTLRGAARLLIEAGRVADRYPGALFMLRPPGITSLLVSIVLRKKGRAYAAELVTDAEENIGVRAFGSRLVGALSGPIIALERALVREAIAVSYVTERHLQARSPAKRRDLEFFAPDGDLEPSLFDEAAETIARIEASEDELSAPSLFLTGRMDRPFKGVDVALRALKILRDGGLDARLTIAGGGALLGEYRALAAELGLGPAARFLGEESDRSRLMSELRAADLFILPTRREGLPRALLEAMALGLPAVATRVAGIPELLEESALIDPEDAEALAEKVRIFASSRALRLEASRRNQARARDFEASKLRALREAFYARVAREFNSS